MTKRLRFLSVSLALAALGVAPAVWAAAAATPAVTAPSATTTNESFQISPPTSTYAADPGTTVSGTIKVTNLTGNDLSLQIGKENFVAKGEEGEIELTDNADPLYSLAPWFDLGLAALDVPARATKSFGYTIGIPQNAEPGGRYGSITFNTIAATLPNGQSGAGVEQQIAAIVFLRINGKANEKLTVASFNAGKLLSTGDLQKKSFFEYGPVSFMARLQNEGNVHEEATGTITVKNMLGIKVATLPLDQHYVIPGAIRRLNNEWPANGKKTLLFGRYTATMTATYASGLTLTATTSFIVIPWKLVLIILAVVLIVFFLFWRGRKRFARAFRILAGKE